jgi:hypothetical protein
MYCVGIGEPETLGMADLVIPGFNGFSFEKLTASFQFPNKGKA